MKHAVKHLWVDVGWLGRGRRRWAEEVLGLSVEVVRHRRGVLVYAAMTRLMVRRLARG
jgi:hypothetical protein